MIFAAAAAPGIVAVILSFRIGGRIQNLAARSLLRAFALVLGLVPVVVPAPSLHGAFILPAYLGLPAALSSAPDAATLQGVVVSLLTLIVWGVAYLASVDTARRRALAVPTAKKRDGDGS